MQVSVIRMPIDSNAAIARRSRAAIRSSCLSFRYAQKSIPRGSVTVGTRTRRSASGRRAMDSSHSTPDSPSDSVSAMR